MGKSSPLENQKETISKKYEEQGRNMGLSQLIDKEVGMSAFLIRVFIVNILACVAMGSPRVTLAQAVPTETFVVSVESAINKAVDKGKADLESALEKGKKDVVGLLIGKEWEGMSVLDRVRYIRTLAELSQFNALVSSAASEDLDNKIRGRGLQHDYLQKAPSWSMGLRVIDKVDDRLRLVIVGRAFGDLADAVTKYYKDNPLLRDRAVLWVLSVALYKEVQAATPPKDNFDKVMAETRDNVTVQVPKKAETVKKTRK